MMNSRSRCHLLRNEGSHTSYMDSNFLHDNRLIGGIQSCTPLQDSNFTHFFHLIRGIGHTTLKVESTFL